MGCNCKRVKSFAEKHGIEEEQTIFQKWFRWGLRMLLFLIAIASSIVLAPIIIFLTIYKMCFGKDNRITLPKFMRKYLE